MSGRCERCENDGWVQVPESYVGRALPGGETAPGEMAATRNSVTPCPSCNAIGWERWRSGHFDPNHACRECLDLRVGGDRRTAAEERITARMAGGEGIL